MVPVEWRVAVFNQPYSLKVTNAFSHVGTHVGIIPFKRRINKHATKSFTLNRHRLVLRPASHSLFPSPSRFRPVLSYFNYRAYTKTKLFLLKQPVEQKMPRDLSFQSNISDLMTTRCFTASRQKLRRPWACFNNILNLSPSRAFLVFMVRSIILRMPSCRLGPNMWIVGRIFMPSKFW